MINAKLNFYKLLSNFLLCKTTEEFLNNKGGRYDSSDLTLIAGLVNGFKSFNYDMSSSFRFKTYVAFVISIFSRYLKLNDEESFNEIVQTLFNQNADRVVPLDLITQFRVIICKKISHLLSTNSVRKYENELRELIQAQAILFDDDRIKEVEQNGYTNEELYEDLCATIKQHIHPNNSSLLLEIAKNVDLVKDYDDETELLNHFSLFNKKSKLSNFNENVTNNLNESFEMKTSAVNDQTAISKNSELNIAPISSSTQAPQSTKKDSKLPATKNLVIHLEKIDQSITSSKNVETAIESVIANVENSYAQPYEPYDPYMSEDLPSSTSKNLNKNKKKIKKKSIAENENNKSNSIKKDLIDSDKPIENVENQIDEATTPKTPTPTPTTNDDTNTVNKQQKLTDETNRSVKKVNAAQKLNKSKNKKSRVRSSLSTTGSSDEYYTSEIEDLDFDESPIKKIKPAESSNPSSVIKSKQNSELKAIENTSSSKKPRKLIIDELVESSEPEKANELQTSTKVKKRPSKTKAKPSNQQSDHEEEENNGHNSSEDESSQPEDKKSTKKEGKVKKEGAQKRHKWTENETLYLVVGVELYGKGNWIKILKEFSSKFHNRTGVHLKDKYRNLEKANDLKRYEKHSRIIIDKYKLTKSAD